MIKAEDIDSDSSEVYDWPVQSRLGKRLAEFEESLVCPICSGFYKNPQLLKCGHSFCSICIRKHFDKAINRVSADQCPVCKEKCELFDMKRNIALCDIVKSFCALRKDLLLTIEDSITRATTHNNCHSTSDVIKSHDSLDKTSSMIGQTKITKRMPHYSFHSTGNSREKIKKVIEQITIESKVKLRVDGTKEDLERRVRELIHLNNAQIDNIQDPLTFDQVIAKVNDIERNREISLLKSSKLVQKIEKIKNGESLKDVENKFKAMAQQIRDRKNRGLEVSQSMNPGDNASSNNEPAENNGFEANKDNDNSQLLLENTRVTNQILSHNINEDYDWGPWRIVMSRKLLRPFFYNTLTGIGQFKIPPELNIVVTDSFDEYPTGDNSDVPLESPSMTSKDFVPSGFTHEQDTRKIMECYSALSPLSVDAVNEATNNLETRGNFDNKVDVVIDMTSIPEKDSTDDNPNDIIDDIESKQDTWSCKYCTYTNNMNVHVCDMCGNVDETQKEFRISSSSSMDINRTANSDARTTRGSLLRRPGYGKEELYSAMVFNNHKLHASSSMRSKSHKKSVSSAHKRTRIH